ncbi:MAG: hypothetical protein SGBAC_006015 [Bacillariaceae sp.]
MSPSMQHVILKEQHRMTDINHPIVILDEDETVPSYQYCGAAASSTSLTSLPPAFNPDFMSATDTTSSKPEPAMAPVQIQTVEALNQQQLLDAAVVKTKAALKPVTAEKVDPFIAAVFQCGFNSNEKKNENVKKVITINDDDDDDDGDDHRDDFSPRSCLDENDIMTPRTLVSPNDTLEKRFVQEPRRKADTSTGIVSTVSSADEDDGDNDDGYVISVDVDTMTIGVTEATASSSSSTAATTEPKTISRSPSFYASALVPAVTGHVPPGTKANPPSAARFIPLAHHQSHYDRLKPYAQLLAWKAQQRTRWAVERTLRLHQKHGPAVKRVVKKSVKAIQKISNKSIGLAVHHGPIVGRKVKRVSIQTLEGIQEYDDANLQILAKSKDVWSRQRGTRAEF